MDGRVQGDATGAVLHTLKQEGPVIPWEGAGTHLLL